MSSPASRTAHPVEVVPRIVGYRGLIRFVLLSVVLPLLAAWWVVPPVHRYFYPPSVVERAPQGDQFGRVTLRLRLPGIVAALPEPLLVCGEAGRATIVYIRFYPNHQAKLGVDFWGHGSYEGDLFTIPDGTPEVTAVFFLPPLFPKEGDPAWGAIPANLQAIRRNSLAVQINGVVRLKSDVHYPQPDHSKLYYGENPLGGSVVSDRFVGQVLEVSQSWE